MESIVKYEPPVDALLALGEVPFNGKWLDYETHGLHRAHIPALVQMATDRRLHLAAGDKAEVWAPLHAWRALGQQRAVTAVIPLLELMDEYEDDDWIHGEIPVVIGMVEAAAIAPVRKFLAESHHALYARVAAARCLGEIDGGYSGRGRRGARGSDRGGTRRVPRRV
jgi:hypothetical protein